MLRNGKMLRTQSKMLGRAFETVDAIGKSYPLKRRRVKSVQTVCGDKELQLVVRFSNGSFKLQIGRIAEGMGVLRAKMGDLLRKDPLNGLWKEYELVAKPCRKTCGL